MDEMGAFLSAALGQSTWNWDRWASAVDSRPFGLAPRTLRHHSSSPHRRSRWWL